MPESLEPLSALFTSAVQIAEVRRRTILRLKSWQAAVGEAEPPRLAGWILPAQVGATTHNAEHLLCVGPGEWLLLSDRDDSVVLRAHMAGDAQRLGLAVVDWSDALVGISVSGPAVTDVLSKGCGLDWHVRSFAPGRCARTRFAQISVVIERLARERFEFQVGRSFGGYLQAWLQDAAVTTAPS